MNAVRRGVNGEGISAWMFVEIPPAQRGLKRRASADAAPAVHVRDVALCGSFGAVEISLLH
jgi:hypothetical protein